MERLDHTVRQREEELLVFCQARFCGSGGMGKLVCPCGLSETTGKLRLPITPVGLLNAHSQVGRALPDAGRDCRAEPDLHPAESAIRNPQSAIERAAGLGPCYYPHFEGCPVRASENSPAIYRRDNIAGEDASPVGTIEGMGPSSVPTGLGSFANTVFPAINRWAIVRGPSGTLLRGALENSRDMGNAACFSPRGRPRKLKPAAHLVAELMKHGTSIRPWRMPRHTGGLLTAIALAGSLLAVAGCHRPLKPIFDTPVPPITWPPDPAQARIRYVGSLTSSADLKPPRKAFQGIVEFFVGAEAAKPLYGPRSVLSTGGGTSLWIADPGGRCLHLFDLRNRSYKKITRMESEQLLSPSGLCVGPGETIFLCDAENAAIYQLSQSTGELIRSLRLADDLERPVALSYDHTREELLVVDVAGHDIKVLSADGRLIRVIGRRGKGAGEFNFPCDIADDGTLIWVADTGNQRVQGLTHAGEPMVAFGEAGDVPGQMAMPKGIATDSSGNIYVLDARFENVQVFDRSGALLLVVGEEGTGPGQFWLPVGISIDPGDRVWICDPYNRRVQVFDRVDGVAHQPAGSARGQQEHER